MKKHRSSRRRSRRKLREKKRRAKRKNIKLLLVIITIISLSTALSYALHSTSSYSKLKTALIIDGLSVEFNDRKFTNQIVQYFKTAGYAVEICNGTEVTVNTYRRMFNEKYKVIVLRVHSAPGDGIIVPKDAIVFFTAEPTTIKKYFAEQLMGFVVKARTLTRGESFYAITPSFIRNAPGKLENAVIIVLSCYGTLGGITVREFLDKGAMAYIGWDGEVSPEYMDKAGLFLVENLVKHHLSIEEAVRKTMEEIGPDPFFGSYLKYYPPNAGSYKL